ncbi:MAG TPA: fatty acid desaturase [Burkholderiales bacterium]|nr:fatty acid desaturase [Burkholderiales bacterium]
MFASVFRSPHGAVANMLALGYALIGYPVGVVLLIADAWALNVVGVLLTAHTLVIAAYLIHEFAHQSIFRTADANARWAEIMSWIVGSCYVPFATLRRKHMRHHLDRADVFTFDYKAFLRRAPAGFTRAVLVLEWLYVPAVELIMHAYVMLAPFLKPQRKSQRKRVLTILAVRAAAFALLGWISPKALLLYALAYMIMLQVLRFTDAYQHTYDAFPERDDGAAIPADKVRDHEYEQANTYSNLVSVAHPWLNLLVLNFSYHNAHHERPVVPWHDLPRLHAQLCPAPPTQVLPMIELLKTYHRYRIARIMSSDYGEVAAQGKDRTEGFLGAVGVSFLTAA